MAQQPQEQTDTGSIRGRFRTQVRDEVKQTALEQLTAGGPQALSVNAIAKQLGVSGPALYRYFASRDELLTELVIDAYHDLARVVAAAASRADNATPTERLSALIHAYRDWAVAQPHRYRLLYSRPLPGYDAHAERLVEASGQLMEVLLAALPADDAGPPPEPLRAQLSRWAASRSLETDTALAMRAIQVWARLHGLVSLEIEGNFGSMGVDAAPFYQAEIEAARGEGSADEPGP